MKASGVRVTAAVAVAAAAVLSATTPALAAAQPAARHATVSAASHGSQAAAWTRWGNFRYLDSCIETGDVGQQNGRWRDWYCSYPASGYDLWVLY